MSSVAPDRCRQLPLDRNVIQIGDIRGRYPFTHRQARRDHVFAANRRRRILRHLGAHHAGSDDIGQDVVLGVVARNRLGRRHHGRFGRGIGQQRRIACAALGDPA